eukprot:758994-Pleurochrysis_carterae.AAC.1
MVALGLQWVPLRRHGTGVVAPRGEQAASEPQSLLSAWLVGAPGDGMTTRRREAQARMVGLSVGEGDEGVRPRAAAQLLLAAAGDMAAVDGVEAALLLAAAAVQGEGVEEGAAMTRLRRAGAACSAALRA